MPLLSVVIPTWSRARLVCEAVESAQAQRPGAVEIIVVDDASTDGTAELLQQRFGPAIRLLRLPSRRGHAGARNAGVALATGELLAFLDSDDLLLPGKLDADLRTLARFPGADVVISDSAAFNEGVAEESTRFRDNGLLAATGGEVRLLRDCRWAWTDSRNGVAIASIVVRREAVQRFGGAPFAEDLACCEDWEFQMRLYHGCRVAVLPEVWVHVRRFDDGTRGGRAMPGQPRTRAQELLLLRDRLTVADRSHWLRGADPYVADTLARFRAETALQLARIEGEP